ncbi:hypothetical protein ACFOD2_16380 [Clavibacter michiganensis subsp. insidiosus]|uniref:hypothetical protein n=1 Tax=Clavibacter michiganensis TaxID=28447 RepID=UPI003608EC1D
MRREPDRHRVLLDLASAVQRISALADLPAWEHGRYVEETRRRFAAAGLDEERAGRCAALAVAGMQGVIGAWLACRDAGADAAAERAVADLSPGARAARGGRRALIPAPARRCPTRQPSAPSACAAVVAAPEMRASSASAS